MLGHSPLLHMAPPMHFHTHGQIFDLVALIKNATSTIESYYLDSSLPIIPSLDSLVTHPLDSAIAPPQFRNAVQVLEGACTQLCATLARPSHTIVNVCLQPPNLTLSVSHDFATTEGDTGADTNLFKDI